MIQRLIYESEKIKIYLMLLDFQIIIRIELDSKFDELFQKEEELNRNVGNLEWRRRIDKNHLNKQPETTVS